RRPELTLAALVEACPGLDLSEDPQVLEQLEIQAKYDGYIARQQAEIERLERYDHWRFPEAIDYAKVVGLSNEVREKLRLQRPETVGQASRIPGVTPAACRCTVHRSAFASREMIPIPTTPGVGDPASRMDRRWTSASARLGADSTLEFSRRNCPKVWLKMNRRFSRISRAWRWSFFLAIQNAGISTVRLAMSRPARTRTNTFQNSRRRINPRAVRHRLRMMGTSCCIEGATAALECTEAPVTGGVA
ncbi:MAG: hypothetical protein EBU81_03915, partial [Proteobacteria bacterium]|nr:hypothetical protein [Pseudomonadota bacterium]